MSESSRLLVVLFALFCASTIYALVLDHHPGWYLPDRTWVTVVIGNILIILALAALELWGVPLRIGHIILTNCAAGAPIVIWQLVQGARRNGENAARDRRRLL